jgi:hypothetical protein
MLKVVRPETGEDHQAFDHLPAVFHGMIPAIILAILSAVAGSTTCASMKPAVAAK